MQVSTSKSETCVFTINKYLRALRPSVVFLDGILKVNENPKFWVSYWNPNSAFINILIILKPEQKRDLTS